MNTFSEALNEFFQTLFDLAPWIAVIILFIAVFIVAWARVYAERYKTDAENWRKKAEWKDKEIAEEVERVRVTVRQEMEASIEDYRRQTALYEQAAARLQEQNGVLYGRYTALEERYAELSSFISDIDGQFIANYRRQWLAYISGATFNSIEEIAYKLALPLVLFLGYDLDSIRVGGTRRVFGVAPQARTSEWVVLGRRDGQARRPLFLVQIVETSEVLTDDFLEQTGLMASTERVYNYVVTNGRDFYLCQRSAPTDITNLACLLRDLWQRWDAVERELDIDVLLPL